MNFARGSGWRARRPCCLRRNSAQGAAPLLTASPNAPFVRLDPFCFSVHLSLQPSLSPSLPVKFHSPFVPGKPELEGFENHFKRQPSPIVFPMAYGDNNSAAAPDLLASITLQDQLIPVKITYVTEE